MTIVVAVLSAAILWAIVVAKMVRARPDREEALKYREALAAAARQAEADRPTSDWLTVYARKYREAQQTQHEARLMLYGTVQKARTEGLPVKTIAELTGLADKSVRRITSQTRVTEPIE